MPSLASLLSIQPERFVSNCEPKSRAAPVAEGYFCYQKLDPEYQKIKDHVGPIQVGEQKVIEPFD